MESFPVLLSQIEKWDKRVQVVMGMKFEVEDSSFYIEC